MSRVRVCCIGVSIDGFGAGPNQELAHPLGVGGEAMFEWFFATRTFQKIHGGEAAIAPSLAAQWQQGANAQINLSNETDTLRDARLLPLGVTWMVLHAAAPTAHPCPYNNGTIKVCSLAATRP